MKSAQKQGTPDYHTTDAQSQTANANIPRETVLWLIAMAIITAMCAFVWLVMVPEADAAMAEAKANLAAAMTGAVDA